MKISVSKKQTRELAKKLASKVLKLKKSGKAVVVGLSGELGSGKTTFCQSFAKALGVKEKVHSPTFVIQKDYSFQSSVFSHLIHIDAYRIKKKGEIIDLGWKKLVNDKKNIIIIEWAENIRKIFPKKHFWINLSHLGKNRRGIDIKLVK